ncbi:GGDEF domain-containing protein [Tannockella kyphosi]|uniref:GGDEF domain-containing protein n=1 Tax=Tannockella kyphosi TaxID=2899121 RepID=UPI002012E637|nr:GGDEF domain-containing protein [Tannockella kyphosi]
MSMLRSEKLRYWRILGLFSFAFMVLTFLLMQTMSTLYDTTSDLSQIQYLSSSTQRCVRMALSGDIDNQLIYQIGSHTESELTVGSQDQMSVLEDESFTDSAMDAVATWENIVVLLEEEELDTTLLELAADNHFNSMTSLSNNVTDLIEELHDQALYLQGAIILVIILVVILATTYFIQTSIVIKQNKELAALAAIDTATGLFNRSRCQDLFKTKLKTAGVNFDAIVVVDLNGLKKTNDELGHQVGDELIRCFATLLKEACDIYTIKPFVGRYGGDEFIVYYQSIENIEEVEILVKELAFLTERFNETMRRFSISYALGYALNDSLQQELTIQQLFEKADESMYLNKQEMKRIKAKEGLN